MQSLPFCEPVLQKQQAVSAARMGMPKTNATVHLAQSAGATVHLSPCDVKWPGTPGPGALNSALHSVQNISAGVNNIQIIGDKDEYNYMYAHSLHTVPADIHEPDDSYFENNTDDTTGCQLTGHAYGFTPYTCGARHDRYKNDSGQPRGLDRHERWARDEADDDNDNETIDNNDFHSVNNVELQPHIDTAEEIHAKPVAEEIHAKRIAEEIHARRVEIQGFLKGNAELR